MATVYLAQDLKHNRQVALKAIHPDLIQQGAQQRFSREIQVAARLQHPHILTVFDSGETRGQLWFTMPYVKGESLRDRLRRGDQLPIPEAVRIAREAALALDYAHKHGIIHRDIKPENILLAEDGSALVADFGIARAVESATGVGPGSRTSGATNLTEAGMAIGTPAYMAPEVRLGASADVRSDIFSLAAVLYEMLTGKMVVQGGGGGLNLRFTQMSDMMPRARLSRPNVPEELEQVIRQAFHPDPGKRFASMAEFSQAIDAAVTGSWRAARPAFGRPRLLVTAAVVALAALGGILWARRVNPGPETKNQPIRIAVLPFENLGDASDAYFADGVTDEVRGKLIQFRQLAVVARTSSIVYRGQTAAAQRIARELGVRYLLTGTVTWIKNGNLASRVRVTPELVEVTDAATPTSRWQGTFDTLLTDVFAVQAAIASRVAGELNIALTPADTAALTRRPTANLAAYDAYLKGEALLESHDVSGTAFTRAEGPLREAVRLDSTFGVAWARLAILYVSYASLGASDSTVTSRLDQALIRSEAFAPEAPETFLARAMNAYLVRNDSLEARRVVTSALARYPNDAQVLSLAANAELTREHFDAALAYGRRALDIDPRSATAIYRILESQIGLRQWQECRRTLDRIQQVNPRDGLAPVFRVRISLAEGDVEAVRRTIRETGPPLGPNGALMAAVSNDQDYWALDRELQDRLLALPVDSFHAGGNGQREFVHAAILVLRGDTARARPHALSGLLAVDSAIRQFPAASHLKISYRAPILIWLGRKAEARVTLEEGMAQRAALLGVAREPRQDYLAAAVYLWLGDTTSAINRLKRSLSLPGYYTPAFLRIDPTFAVLRGNREFEALVRGLTDH